MRHARTVLPTQVREAKVDISVSRHDGEHRVPEGAVLMPPGR